MKKILLLATVVFTVSILRAQNTSFGVQAGVTFPSFKIKSEEEDVSKSFDIKPGFTVGVVSNIALGSMFSFQPSLNFIQKGGKEKEDDESEKLTLNYLELPLNFVFNASSKSGKFFAGAGPSLSFGLSGKEKFEAEGIGEEEEDINFGSDEDELKAFELGLNIIAGYQFTNGLFLAANYNAGLSDLSNVDGTKFHNRYFALRVGFMFGGNSKK